MQNGSQCIGNGIDGYDIGAKFYTDIPNIPDFFAVSETETKGSVLLRWLNPSTTVNGNPVSTLSSVKIWQDDILVAESDQVTIGDTLEISINIDKPDYYRYRICAVDNSDLPGRILSTPVDLFGGEIEGIVIWELDGNPASGDAFANSIAQTAYDKYVYKTNSSGKYVLTENIDAVFVCLGVYDGNHVLSDPEGNVLKDYLDSGGNVYMEGGDTWAYDDSSPVHPYFHITGVADGTSDLQNIVGIDGTDFVGFDFTYAGVNSWIDHLDDGADAQLILQNKTPEYGVAVAYSNGSYSTIGTSFQFGGLTDGDGINTKTELLTRMLNYFGFGLTGIEDMDNNIPEKFALNQNYPNPFNPTTTISYQLKRSSQVKLTIYNALGQEVSLLVNEHRVAGTYELQWNGKNDSGILMPSGIYFVKMEAGSFLQTRRMLLLK